MKRITKKPSTATKSKEDGKKVKTSVW
jgi:hypothetical protein